MYCKNQMVLDKRYVYTHAQLHKYNFVLMMNTMNCYYYDIINFNAYNCHIVCGQIKVYNTVVNRMYFYGFHVDFISFIVVYYILDVCNIKLAITTVLSQ